MSQQSIDKRLLQTFIPVNALSEQDLDRLLETHEIRSYKAGDTLFSAGDSDNRTLYLLTGAVDFISPDGSVQSISAGGLESWHPLENSQPRKVTAKALNDVTIVSFDRANLDAIMAWNQSAGYVALDIDANAAYAGDREWMIKLMNSKLFYQIPPSNIQEIFKRLKPLRFRQGDVVIRQGDDADCCYIIRQGLSEVLITPAGAEEATPVAILEEGQWFGEEALLSGKPRNASVVMATDGILMRLDRKDFDELLRAPVIRTVSADEALAKVSEGARWIDVRTSDEYEQSHFKQALNMPLNTLRLKSRLLDGNRAYVLYCDTGTRSATAAFLLKNAGFVEIDVLEGGLNGVPDKLKNEITDF